MTALDADAERRVQPPQKPADPPRRRGSPRPVLFVPGIDGSGPAHWQTHWHRAMPSSERLQQADWARPTLGEWTATLVDAIRRRPGTVIVAHSLGCPLIAHFVEMTQGCGVVGALLVAPADVEAQHCPDRRLEAFSPAPRRRLPFPCSVVASRNDPYMSLDRAKIFAADWGARFIDLGAAGHINAASGYGPWSAGRSLLVELMGRIAAPDGRLLQE